MNKNKPIKKPSKGKISKKKEKEMGGGGGGGGREREREREREQANQKIKEEMIKRRRKGRRSGQRYLHVFERSFEITSFNKFFQTSQMLPSTDENWNV